MSLPERYARWREAFDVAARSSLRPDMAILDVGAGRHPTIPIAARPARCAYVGLDLSAAELADAPRGSYDEGVVSDVVAFRPELADRFDLALSMMVFEHVRPLPAALDNIHAYLRPGGALVALTSGTFAPFALANRLLPAGLSRAIQKTLLGKNPATIFPAHYDRCWDSALRKALANWGEVQVIPLYLGATYLNFAPPLRSVYLLYEEWTRRGNHRNLASHYVLHAKKAGSARAETEPGIASESRKAGEV